MSKEKASFKFDTLITSASILLLVSLLHAIFSYTYLLWEFDVCLFSVLSHKTFCDLGSWHYLVIENGFLFLFIFTIARPSGASIFIYAENICNLLFSYIGVLGFLFIFLYYFNQLSNGDVIVDVLVIVAADALISFTIYRTVKSDFQSNFITESTSYLHIFVDLLVSYLFLKISFLPLFIILYCHNYDFFQMGKVSKELPFFDVYIVSVFNYISIYIFTYLARSKFIKEVTI